MHLVCTLSIVCQHFICNHLGARSTIVDKGGMYERHILKLLSTICKYYMLGACRNYFEKVLAMDYTCVSFRRLASGNFPSMKF